MGSTIFTSEDISAPSLTGEKASFINLLKKCLVQGYGSKLPLGWTIPFEDVLTNKCVFRAPIGTRTFFQVFDNAEGYIAAFAEINAFETMSNPSTGIHPVREPGTTYKYVCKSETSNTIKRKWRIIGDEKGFYFMVARTSVQGVASTTVDNMTYHVYYWGDYTPFRQEERNVFHFSCTTANTIYNHMFPSSALTVEEIARVMRDINNEKGSVFCGYGSCNSYSNTRFGNNVSLSPLAGRWLWLPATIHTTNAILGWMPGFNHALYKFPTTFNASDFQEFYESDSDGITGYSFVSQCYNTAAQVNSQRLMITIGSNFRNES